MNLRKIYFFLFYFALVFSANAQKELAISLEKDEFCSYVQLSSQNIQELLLSNEVDYKDFMEKKGFRKAELGTKNEYMAISTKLNHVRLLSKNAQTLQFTFSPIPSNLVNSFLTDLNSHAKLISSNQKGNKTTLIVEFPTLSRHQHQISWEEKNDTEEYVGRTILVKTLVVEVRGNR